MLKLKAKTLTNLTKFFFKTSKTRNVFYAATFLENLRDKMPFFDCKEDKLTKYWACQTIPDIIAIADKMYEEEKYVEVYELLNRMKFSNEVEVIWRLVRALHTLAQDTDLTLEMKREMIEEAYGILTVAAPFGEGKSDFHKWLAIIMDSKNGAENLEQRVKKCSEVRDQLSKACELNPKDYAEPPECTFQDAYNYLNKAEDLHPRCYLPNMYLLGRCCVMLGQYYRAKYYLNLATSLPATNECEHCCASKAQKLLTKLEKYDLGKDILFDQYTFGYHE